MSGLFSKLKKRRIVQIVVSYLAASWIALEVISQLTQQNVLPDVAYAVTLIWCIGGIGVALLVGWYHGEKGQQKAPAVEVAGLIVIAVGVLVVSGSTVRSHVADRSATEALASSTMLDLRRIAVAYFDDLSPMDEYRHIADGLTEELIAELSEVRALEVISRNGVAQFRDSDLAPDSIARLLEAGTVVGGSIEPVGERGLRVHIRLLEGRSGAQIARTTFEGPRDQIFDLQAELIEETARLLRETLGEEIRLRGARLATSSPAAWILVQRAERERKEAETALRNHEGDAAMAAFARADSLLGQVEALDTAWLKPTVLRGEIDYRRARIAHSRHDRVDWIRRGMEHAERAVRMEASSGPALALRGILRYYHYLQRVTPDPAEHEALLVAAQTDLEKAVELDPTQAQAWSALQHLYYRTSLTDAVLAGRRAYEEDAYLEVAEDILWRLFTANYDLAQLPQAQRWCEEGSRRFPHNTRFTDCQLLLMASGQKAPDPDQAWAFTERVRELTPEARREYADIQAHLFTGATLARAGLPDSARSVLDRAERRLRPEIDPRQDLLMVAAGMYAIALQDHERALELLKRVKSARPTEDFAHNWWWSQLRSDPRFTALARAH